jgi:hypothetical protein
MEVELGQLARMKVWYGQDPVPAFEVEDWLSLSVEGSEVQPPLPSIWALDMLVPTGPVWHFAHLGAEFEPDGSGLFSVRIGFGVPLAFDPGQTLMPKGIDEVDLGLSPFAAERVLDAVSGSLVDFGPLPSGQLFISRGLMGRAGSSPNVLRAAARTLFLLPARAEADRADQVRSVGREAVGWAFRARPMAPDSPDLG